ncbi:hypothetical protein [Flavobacterium geliluteum]|uniref:Phage tail protein n=1 Tax=Flavobacterium geliluteum TaxID=2816120 RepID=A0A941AY77_9FLAO|nr:hypothetical protein [Flavobacterium geliluteum]MBP4140020.1 hypothetical protein [Flavobacterium geliluteum]
MAFNSREFEWADLTLIVGGRDVTGVRGVKYSEKIEREPIYAKGRKPKTIQSGNIAYEGEFMMLQSEYDALEISGGGTILSLSVDALVSFGNPLEGNYMKTDALDGIRFLEGVKEYKQGDKFADITVPFICLDIRKNV